MTDSSSVVSEHEPSKLIIIDFGSQFTQLLINFYRKGGVIVDIIPMDDLNKFDDNIEWYIARKYCGIILSGGPGNIKDDFSNSQISDLINKLLNISSKVFALFFKKVSDFLILSFLSDLISFLYNLQYSVN